MNDFYRAAIPEPVTLLGLRLKPFALGHLILLNRVESAFVTGAAPDFNDLAISVFICSQTYRDAIAAFDDPTLPKFMRKWADKLHGQRWWSRKQKPIDLPAKCEAFAQYIKDGSISPYYSMPEATGTVSEVERAQAVKIRLLSETNLTEDEILNRPWGLCIWDYACLRTKEGAVIHGEGYRDAIQEARDFADKLAAKLAKGKNGTP